MTSPCTIEQQDSLNLSLESFKGPIDLLFELVIRRELPIVDILIQEIAEHCRQYVDACPDKTYPLNEGSDFLLTTSALLLFKTQALCQKLLPEETFDEEKHEDLLNEQKNLLFTELLDYCRFKKLSLKLHEMEENARQYFVRRTPPIENKSVKHPPQVILKNISLNTLAENFAKILEKAKPLPSHQIDQEQWTLEGEIEVIKSFLREKPSYSLEDLFQIPQYREECIARFLALLELMKQGFLFLQGCKETQKIYVKKGHDDRNDTAF